MDIMKIFEKDKTTINDIKHWMETYLEEVEFDLADIKVQDAENAWFLPDDKINGFYIIIDTDSPEDITIELLAPLFELPKENILPFYRKCLEINNELYNTSIVVRETRIYLFCKQDIEYIRENEFIMSLNYHMGVAGYVCDLLKEEFEVMDIED